MVDRSHSPRSFDATFVAGIAQAAALRKAGVKGVIRVPFGVDAGTFHPGQRSDACRRELLQGAEGPLLVAVGRLAFEKRWDVALAAFEESEPRTPVRCWWSSGMGRRGPASQRWLARAFTLPASCGTVRRSRAPWRAPMPSFTRAPTRRSGSAWRRRSLAASLRKRFPTRGAAESADPSTCALYPSLDARACAAALLDVLRGRGDDARARALAAAARVPTAEDHVRAVVHEYEALLRTKAPRQPVTR